VAAGSAILLNNDRLKARHHAKRNYPPDVASFAQRQQHGRMPPRAGAAALIHRIHKRHVGGEQPNRLNDEMRRRSRYPNCRLSTRFGLKWTTQFRPHFRSMAWHALQNRVLPYGGQHAVIAEILGEQRQGYSASLFRVDINHSR